jgi:hypothetical protein
MGGRRQTCVSVSNWVGHKRQMPTLCCCSKCQNVQTKHPQFRRPHLQLKRHDEPRAQQRVQPLPHARQRHRGRVVDYCRIPHQVGAEQAVPGEVVAAWGGGAGGRWVKCVFG